ncbi:L-seryl-tRNA(Sec) selenium transferase [Phycisphaerae bacterium RAS1]|nr:L-seryl-tRNA(Sec) selenium transferase [Phycisphaerae bacterium RAS1]
MTPMSSPAPDAAARNPLRDLPSVDQLLRHAAIATLLEEFPRHEVLTAVRNVIDARRAAIQSGRPAAIDSAALALGVREEIYRRATPSLRRVINATGIVLHTGLGRAPLAAEAVAAVAEVAGGYCNLELDLATGRRGDRHEHCRELLRELTGAEDALVVNNNAAATFLALHALAGGREAIVSRGQLVEIGGSYRMPDIMAAAGCRMVEVGTTNRTRIGDYEKALTPETAVLLRVHASNYRIEGFVESASLEQLAALGRSRSLVVIDDLGSGLIDQADALHADSRRAQPAVHFIGGLLDNGTDADQEATERDAPPVESGRSTAADWDEPTVKGSVAGGADITLFSGDKLLGGPQAGVAVGRAELIARMRRDPLMRTFRPDKMTLAALEATLRLYRDPATLAQRCPTLRMLLAPPESLQPLAMRLAELTRRSLPDATVDVLEDRSYAGGGSLPTLALPTWVVRVRVEGVAAAGLAAALRRGDSPVACRVRDESLLLDCRTLSEPELSIVAAALAESVREGLSE